VSAISTPPLLQASGLSLSFGAHQVIRGVDFALLPGTRHALIGPNGAGKTTFVNLLTGVLQPHSGSIRIGEVDVTALPQADRVRRGLARTFQINQLFRNLTPFESVSLAVAQHRGHAERWWRQPIDDREVTDAAMTILDRLALVDDAFRPVGELAYGSQRLVEIAIALGLEPRILIMDEPAAGVPLGERDRVLSAVESLGADQAILIIEHDMDLVFRFASEITVLVDGAVLCHGAPDTIARDVRVREAYLGGALDG
jgi:branched-chain amino acid transport system ATP-binding protein